MIDVMAKKKTPSGKPSRSKGGRARDKDEVRPVTVELPIPLDNAVEKYRQSVKRTKRSVIELALEALLTKEGFWPPAKTDEPD